MEWGDGPDAISAATDELDQSALGWRSATCPPTPTHLTYIDGAASRSWPLHARQHMVVAAGYDVPTGALDHASWRTIPRRSSRQPPLGGMRRYHFKFKLLSFGRRMFHLSMKMAAPGDEQASTATAAAVVAAAAAADAVGDREGVGVWIG
uniref:Uncharacterized protein n=1 Tax=Oryza barthii TaxID=65489 RepID=A0A0D3H1T0_9ORYZ